MKLLKFIAAIMLAVIFSFITRHYLSVVNQSVLGEFTPIPHFIADEALSFKLSFIPIFAVYLIIFIYLASKKYFNFLISGIGVLLAVIKYKSVVETHLPVDMAFLPALLNMGMILCIFMAIGIVVQLIVDGGVSAIRLVNKNKK